MDALPGTLAVQGEQVGDPLMQTWDISTRCSRCDVLLSGREQFMGHMMHGHDMGFEQADAVWKSLRAGTHNIH